jgi:deazaflavin-dependent oxidoreductase (nitroreductase family)
MVQKNSFAEQLWKQFTQLQIRLYRRFKGQGIVGKNTILITTIGRRTGEERTNPVYSVKDGDNFVVIASYGGAPAHPAWYLNLLANPHVTVEDHGTVIPTIANTVTEEDERQRLWNKMVAIYPPYNNYQKRTARQIPVVLLHPLPNHDTN